MAWHELLETYNVQGVLDKIIALAIQRGTWTMYAILLQLTEVKEKSLEEILKNMIPLIIMHFQYFILKTHGNKMEPKAILNTKFTEQLASCTSQEDFKKLTEETKKLFQLPETIQPMINMEKFQSLANDIAEQHKKLDDTPRTAQRLAETVTFAMNLSKSGKFKHQLYENIASVLAQLEQESPTILTHFNSLMALGTVTYSLARQYEWDTEYINQVKDLYTSEELLQMKWLTQDRFTKLITKRTTLLAKSKML